MGDVRGISREIPVARAHPVMTGQLLCASVVSNCPSYVGRYKSTRPTYAS